jgi:hypothetical protein
MGDGICPFSVWRPGPAWKVFSWQPTNPKDGIVDHSMEGWRPGAESRLFGPDEASWHFSVYQDGTIEQHYEPEATCWHAGTQGNLHYVGIEHEGKDQPLTDAQYQATLRLHRWAFAENPGWGAPELRKNLHEHNWLWPTSCPNGRIPWVRLMADLEDDMAINVHALVKKQGEDAIYLANLETGTLTHVPSPPIAAVFDLPLGTEVKELAPNHDIWTWSILEPR